LSVRKLVPNFNLQYGLLCCLSHLCVPSRKCAKRIWEAHYSREARHFGVEKIVEVLQKHFFWPKLRQDVCKHIIFCTTFIIVNPTIKKQGLYTPLPTPDRPWDSISMDYMSGLPSNKHGNDCVFMLIDQFSKMVVSAPCKKSITVVSTTNLFFELVCVQSGLPLTIISNLDNRFLSTF
jgi:hypothetical protein